MDRFRYRKIPSGKPLISVGLLFVGRNGVMNQGFDARIAGLLALCLQASLLLRFAPDGVADAFCATRLGGDWGAVLGTLPPGTPVAALVDRARITTV